MTAQRAAPEEEWPADGLEEVACCPVCHSERRTLLHEALQDRVFFCAPGKWNMWRCEECSTGYLNPRPTADTLGLAYQSYYTHADVEEKQYGGSLVSRIKLGLRNDFLNRTFGTRYKPALPGGHWLVSRRPKQQASIVQFHTYRSLPLPKPGQQLLDVGCGNGKFLTKAQQMGWSVEGIELDEQAVEAANRSGLKVFAGTLEQAKFKDAEFDAITICHVMEHLPRPVETMRECLRILKPGGVLWVAVPNLGSGGHERFGASWRGLEPPRHLVMFTLESLKRLMTDAGFVIAGQQGGLITASTYEQSDAMSQGLDPNVWRSIPLALQQEGEAALEDGLRHPERSDEVIVVAKKPAG